MFDQIVKKVVIILLIVVTEGIFILGAIQEPSAVPVIIMFLLVQAYLIFLGRNISKLSPFAMRLSYAICALITAIVWLGYRMINVP